MVRRALAILLAATLVLGWTGAGTFAVTIAACASAATGVSDDPCKTCDETGERGQPSCPSSFCAGPCAGGPMVSLMRDAAIAVPASDSRVQAPPPALGAPIRALQPDLPPPR